MGGFVFIREILFDKYLWLRIEKLLICLCQIQIIEVSWLHTRQTLESDTALEQMGQKNKKALFTISHFNRDRLEIRSNSG